MQLKNDPRCVWVAPGNDGSGEGTCEKPFRSMDKALDRLQPGRILVLSEGVYHGDMTIQKSGGIDLPLRIMAAEGATVEWEGACWYFYDVSDIICSGITFRNSPAMAISVIGKCLRNRFESLKFINCGIEREESCTFFFGGSGQACNIVESCIFERAPKGPGQEKATAVGILISEGDFQGGEPNCDLIISKNTVNNYAYGILVGSHDITSGEYGHVISHNTLNGCTDEGIMVKCGDTQVRGNVLRNCVRHSISVIAGKYSAVEDNRIIDCGKGIRVSGTGHTIANNCIIRCDEEAIRVASQSLLQNVPGSNVIIEQNTCIGWGKGSDTTERGGIFIEPGTTCIIRNNMFHGRGLPLEFPGNVTGPFQYAEKHIFSGNLSSGGCRPINGSIAAEVGFSSADLDNYTNDSGYGACGWMLCPDPYDPDSGSVADIPSYAPPPPAADENPVEQEDNEDGAEVVMRSLFMGNEQRDLFASMQDEETDPGDEGPW